MEIQNSGLNFGLDAYVTSALESMRRQSKRRVSRDLPSLSSEILGRNLSREELFRYKSRLIFLQHQMDLIEGEQLLDFPELEPAWHSVPNLRVGAAVWLPPNPLPVAQIETPRLQEEHRERCLGSYQRAAMEHEPIQICRSRIVVGAGSERLDTEMEDAVEMSSLGVESLVKPDWPLLVTRMPPAFPRRQDVLRFKRAA